MITEISEHQIWGHENVNNDCLASDWKRQHKRYDDTKYGNQTEPIPQDWKDTKYADLQWWRCPLPGIGGGAGGSPSLSLPRLLLSCSAIPRAKQAVCQLGSRCHANFHARNHAADVGRWGGCACRISERLNASEMPTRRHVFIKQDARIAAVASLV